MLKRNALLAWFAMLLLSVANGAVRDLTYGRWLDALTAQQLSTGSGMLLLGLFIRDFIRRQPPASARQALALGGQWLALTVAFEFLFFHYLGGHSWAELLANYDLVHGRLWPLLLVWIAVAPYIFHRLRHSPVDPHDHAQH